MHLSVVVALIPKHVNHLTNRVASPHRPIRDFHHHFLSILGTLQFLHGDDDVTLQDSRRHRKECHTMLYIQSADKRLLATFHNLNYLAMQLVVAIFLGMNAHLDTVARQRMMRVFIIDGDAHAVVGINIVASA